MRRAAILGVIGAALLAVGVPYSWAAPKKLQHELAVSVLIAAIPLTVLIAITLRLRTIVRHVSARQEFVCQRCTYPLPSQPEWGTCPECGQADFLATTDAAWRKAYDAFGGPWFG